MSKEAIKYITAMLAAFGPDEAISMTKETWAKIHEAMQALAQPEQEPVAYSYTSRITGAQGFSHHPMPRFIDSESWDIHPLYTSPPASKPWVGLTIREIEWCFEDASGENIVAARNIEAKLREKNA